MIWWLRKSRPPQSKIVTVERIDPSNLRVTFDGGGTVIVRVTRAAGYWMD